MSRALSCREILDNLSSYIDAELDPSLCEEIEAHMNGCTPCVAFLNTLKKTVVLYRCTGAEESVPERIRIDLHRFLRGAVRGAPKGRVTAGGRPRQVEELGEAAHCRLASAVGPERARRRERERRWPETL